MAPTQEQAELHVEELFKGQLAPGLFPFLHRIGKVYLLIGFERRHGGKGRLAAAVPARQDVQMLPGQVQGLAHGFADILLAQAIGQAVQGDEALAFGPPFFRVRPIHLAAAISPFQLAKSRQSHAHAELAFLESLVEPDQLGRPRPVADHNFQQRQAPAGPHFLD